MRGYCRFAIFLVAGWCGCVVSGDRRVDVTTPQPNIAFRREKAHAPAAGERPEESQRYSVVRVFYGTDRARHPDLPAETNEFYSGHSGRLEFGYCHVSLPDDKEHSEDERPRIWQFEYHAGSDRQTALLAIEPVDRSAFLEELRSDVNDSDGGEAFVFVHGCDVGFADAVRQTARIAHELQFDGPPVVYSWPSGRQLRDCLIDQTTVLESQSHLVRFLQTVSEESGAERVHLIAHGTGTQLVATALEQLAATHSSHAPHFNEVVLAAPDIDAEKFKQDIAPRIIRVADRVTVYASEDDPDLLLSAQLHGSRRLGQGGSDLVIIPDVPGIDVVDVAARNFRFLEPEASGDGNELLGDIRQVFAGVATTQRGLQPHPARQLAWRLPTSDVQLVSHRERVDESRPEDVEEDPAETVANAGVWSRMRQWVRW